jgi:glutamate mutase epsilon subunit
MGHFCKLILQFHFLHWVNDSGPDVRCNAFVYLVRFYAVFGSFQGYTCTYCKTVSLSTKTRLWQYFDLTGTDAEIFGSVVRQVTKFSNVWLALHSHLMLNCN